MAAASGLHLDDYKRYGRQMILDGIGLPGTRLLVHSLQSFHGVPIAPVLYRSAQAPTCGRGRRWRWGTRLPSSAVPRRGRYWQV